MDPSSWSVDDVAEWMTSIGLEHKSDAIKQNNVNGAKLVTMSETEFKSIGLSGLQVRKIRNEIPQQQQQPATGGGGGSSVGSYVAKSPTSSANAAISSAEADALRRELDTLKSQVATLTSSLNSLKLASKPTTTTAVATATPVMSSSAAGSPSNAPSHSMHVPGFCRDCWIEGNQAQILTVVMGPGDVIHADKGSMVHMSSYINMSTTTGGQGFGRLLTGESLFLTEYTYRGPTGTADKISFTPDFAGQIIPIDMRRYGNHIICQKSSLLASSPTVQVSVAFTQSLGAGFFGGEGFVLQGLRGSGHAFLNARGTIITMVLRPGEQRIVSTGCLVGMESSVQYDIVTTGGLGNMLLSGEGVFNTRLTGPGTIWLESQDLSRLFNVLSGAAHK